MRSICQGLVKHGDSVATRSNTRSPEDAMHLGRRWAKEERNVPNPLSPRHFKAKIAAHYREHPPEKSAPSEIVRSIIRRYSCRGTG